MMEFKTQEYKMLRAYEDLVRIKVMVKHNDIFDDLDDRDNIYKVLESLTRYLFRKIED